MSPKPVQNGRLSVAPTSKLGMPAPRKIDSHDYSGPLAAVYYKKERERRRQEKAGIVPNYSLPLRVAKKTSKIEKVQAHIGNFKN